ncbi:MAG: sugar phosphate isomerase/epimerase [Clostridia bacterium]|nr:sugar phosphate isomerase/epimerase [Clostridia bacterium]
MFDILIGTLIGAGVAERCMPLLNEKGFESYELTFGTGDANGDLPALAQKVLGKADGRPIAALGLYGNTLQDEDLLKGIKNLIVHAHDFGCDVVSMFAGAKSGDSVEAAIPLFKEVFSGLVDLAEKHDVRLAIENCGGGWRRCDQNIAFCEDAWNLMFSAVDSPRLGLEWEPAHQLHGLVDVEAQLRRIAHKVIHLHGKDATVARDLIRDYGLHSGRPWCYDRTPGYGDSNWANLFTILLHAGFRGSCDIEGYHDLVHYDDMEWSSQLVGLDYLKRCRGGLEFFDGPDLPHGYQGKRHKS